VPDGHQYTLWLARGEKAEAVANFRTGDDGTRVVALPGRLVDVKAAMVTVEPLSGANPAAQGPELIFGTLR
jgi:hypothetical protein